MSIQSETPTLSAVIQAALAKFASELHVCMPAQIISYDRTKCMASVLPLLQRKLRDGTTITWPPITNVPVVFERTAKFSLTYELNPGDTGQIIISERSLDRWLASTGGVVDPSDPRKHAITDAIFHPGLTVFSKPAYTEKDVAVFKNVNSKIRMYESGKFAVYNLASGEELIKIIHDLLIALEQALITTAIGPQPFTPSTIQKFTDIQTRLDTLKE